MRTEDSKTKRTSLHSVGRGVGILTKQSFIGVCWIIHFNFSIPCKLITVASTKSPALFVPLSVLRQWHKQESRTKSPEPSTHPTPDPLPPSCKETLKGKMMRVIGKLHTYDIQTSRMWIQVSSNPAESLVINTSGIEPFAYKEGALFQFIGELDEEEIEGKNMLVLRAILYRNVDGLDLNMFLKAHATRMEELGRDSFV